MNHSVAEFRGTSSMGSSYLEGAVCGIAGQHFLNAQPDPTGLNDPEIVNDTTYWRYSASHVCAKGEVAVSRSKYWNVFLFGQAKSVKSLGAKLDKVEFTSGKATLAPECLRSLCWDLLPSGCVFAFHNTVSAACLICDPTSFRPLYFARSTEELCFSTNLGSLRRRLSITGLNTDKITQMLAFGHRTGRRILWQGIECVAPGEIVFHVSGVPTQRIRFWSPQNVFDVEERRRLERQSTEQTMQEAQDKVEASVRPLLDLPNLAVPCGGGVDSSFLACYAARWRKTKTPVWCINQPEARLKESDWMTPFSRQHDFECTYANINRELFLSTLLEMLSHSHQPLPGPNYVGGKVLGKLAKADGVEYLLSGELCDTVFGGLSGFYHLSPRFRVLRIISRLPYRYRVWLMRALSDVPAWLLELMHVGHSSSAALIGGGDLENAEIIHEAEGFRYDGQTDSQYLADVITWMQMRTVPSALHAAFYDRIDSGGPSFEFPFANAEVMRLGIHLPYFLKRRAGHNKWLWRNIAAKYVGKEVAFRRKESFPTQTERWLNKIPDLLEVGFLTDLLAVDVAKLHAAIPAGDTSRWTLTNCELWGRIHCRGERPEKLFEVLA